MIHLEFPPGGPCKATCERLPGSSGVVYLVGGGREGEGGIVDGCGQW